MKANNPNQSQSNRRGGRKPPQAAPTSKPKAKSTPATAKPKTEIPGLLLEGDAPPPASASASGPGQRYALGPVPPSEAGARPEDGGELPEAYGTQRLMLTARDPHWLYAHWDLTREQLRGFARRSADGRLGLRIYRDTISGQPFSETTVHSESRNWFVHVGLGGTKFQAELGYYDAQRQWVRISTSGATLTPPDRMSDDYSVAFETLPPDLQYRELVELVKSAVSDSVPLVEAIQQLRASNYPGLPERQDIQAKRWSPEQEALLARLISMDAVRRVWIGSLEITEVIRRELRPEAWSGAAAQRAPAGLWSGVVPGLAAGISSITSVSSPFGGAERRPGFWFNVNAELVIYGATEPDAAVTIGGRSIKLRPDGTFGYRFALPDGEYFLPAVATSADGTDQRAAELSFRRGTRYHGDVGKHPQAPGLKPPLADHVT